MNISKKQLKELAESSKEVATAIWNDPELLGFYGNSKISDEQELELTPVQEKLIVLSDKRDQEIKDGQKPIPKEIDVITKYTK